MTAFSQRFIGLTVLTVALASSLPLHAEQASNASPPSNATNSEQEHGEWNNENFDRQEFREEMGEIRKEHEELEDAHDKLVDQCTKAAAQQADQCQVEKQALKERHEKLHERMHALREKMEAARKERHEEYHAGN